MCGCGVRAGTWCLLMMLVFWGVMIVGIVLTVRWLVSQGRGSAQSPALAVWLCLAEGMLEHFRNQSATARDRIRRLA